MYRGCSALLWYGHVIVWLAVTTVFSRDRDEKTDRQRKEAVGARSLHHGHAQPDQVGSLFAMRPCPGGSPAPAGRLRAGRCTVAVTICMQRHVRGLTQAATLYPGRRGCTPKFLDETLGDDAEEEIVYTVPDKIVFKVALCVRAPAPAPTPTLGSEPPRSAVYAPVPDACVYSLVRARARG